MMWRRRRAPQVRLVVVEWVDCHAHSAGWETTDELRESSQPRPVVSAGWLIPDVLAGHLTIAQDQDTSAGGWHGVSHIPTGCVVTVRGVR